MKKTCPFHTVAPLEYHPSFVLIKILNFRNVQHCKSRIFHEGVSCTRTDLWQHPQKGVGGKIYLFAHYLILSGKVKSAWIETVPIHRRIGVHNFAIQGSKPLCSIGYKSHLAQWPRRPWLGLKFKGKKSGGGGARTGEHSQLRNSPGHLNREEKTDLLTFKPGHLSRLPG